MNNLIREAIEWCKGKNWIVRTPLIAYFAYVLIRHLADPMYTSIIGGINLGIHELGHLITGFFGQNVSIAGGTIFQLALPVFAVFNFYRQRDFFAIALSFGWLSTNFFNIATYAGDARKLELPLVSIGGGSVYHDWEYMLGSMHILQYDTLIAGMFRVLAVLSMLACFAAGSWLLWQMARDNNKEGYDIKTGI